MKHCTFTLFSFALLALSMNSFAQSDDPDSKESKRNVTAKFDSLKQSATSMKLIKGGELNGEKITDYQLDEDLVSVAQYKNCIKAGVCAPPPDNGNWSATFNRTDRDNHPINEITYYNAVTYCSWVDKRLPTAEEWQWAAQGREEARIYPWGNEVPTKENACWMRYDEKTDTGNGPCELNSNQASSRDGVKNMAGNLWEWTSSRDVDGKLVVLKGGAWYNDNPDKLKTSSKGFASPYHNDNGSDGFRCAK